MKWIDVVILVVVLLLFGLVFYFRFLRPGNSECANCAKRTRKSVNRLREYYYKNRNK
jgi:preprotein translocase subunit YajC